MDFGDSMINDLMTGVLARMEDEIGVMDAALTRIDREIGEVSERAWEAKEAGQPIPDDADRETRLVLASNRLDNAMGRYKAVANALRSASYAARADAATWAEVRDILDGQAPAAPAPDERSMTDDQWDAVVASRVLTDAAEAIDAALIAGVAR